MTTTVYALDRHEDETGISGTGVVAWAFDFHDSDGVFLIWDSRATLPTTIAWYPNLDAVRAIHGHNGKTELVRVDQTARAYDLALQIVERLEDAVDRLLIVLYNHRTA